MNNDVPGISITELRKAIREKMVASSFHSREKATDEKFSIDEFYLEVIEGKVTFSKPGIDQFSGKPMIVITVTMKDGSPVTGVITENNNDNIMEPYFLKTIYRYKEGYVYEPEYEGVAIESIITRPIPVRRVPSTVAKKPVAIVAKSCSTCSYHKGLMSKHICKKHEIMLIAAFTTIMFLIKDPADTICELWEGQDA